MFFFIFFLRKRLIHFLSLWLVTVVLFVPVGKRSNSRSQMFYKIENLLISLKMLLKSCNIHRKIPVSWSFFLINFIKKNTQTLLLSREYCEMFKYSFFTEHLLFIIPFRNLTCDRILWKSLGAKLIFVIFLAPLLFFSFIVLESEVHCHFLYILFSYQNI